MKINEIYYNDDELMTVEFDFDEFDSFGDDVDYGDYVEQW